MEAAEPGGRGSRTHDQLETCECGAIHRITRWSVIDESQRPDLVARLAAGDLLFPECPACSRPLAPEAVRVLRRTASLPLLLVFTADGSPAPPSAAQTEVLASPDEKVTVLNLPFEAAEIVLPRNADTDLADPQSAVAGVGETFGSEVAARYANFLASIELGREEAMCESLLDSLSDVRELDQFKRFLDEHPQVLDDGMLAMLEGVRTVPALAPSVVPVLKLLQSARTNPDSAWARFRAAWDENERSTPDLPDAAGRFVQLASEERWDDLIDFAAEVLPQAESIGAGFSIAEAHRYWGYALLKRTTGGDRVQDLDEAVSHLEAAADLLPAGALLGDVYINLAAAYGDRITGDPTDNSEAALEALRVGIQQLGPDDDPEILATAHTNLARSLRVREKGTRAGNLREALEHARAALELRSPDKHGASWAYSQNNLADVLIAIAAEEKQPDTQAREAFQEILAQQAHIEPKWLVGNAHLALAERLQADALRHSEDDDAAARVASLKEARDHADTAIDLVDDLGPNQLRGRALAMAGSVRAAMGDRPEAVARLESALDFLTPTASPRDSRATARALADLHAADQRWDAAADAFRVALEADRLALHARRYTSGREAEIGYANNLARFAAYAIARAGHAKEAALVLEEGRARELRRRTPLVDAELDQLEALAPDLHSAYARAFAQLAASPLGAASDAASGALHDAVEAIREIPEFETFGRPEHLRDLESAVETNSPLVYVAPAPAGMLILFVSKASDDELAFDVIFLDAPNGQEVFLTLMAGDFEAIVASNFTASGPPSFLGTATGLTPGEVADALDYIMPWFGERIGRPIHDGLAASGADSVTLIPCGPIAICPLHAATWSDGNESTCLVDRFVVRYAPSAALHATSRTRAEVRQAMTPHLVAIGNPTDDLHAAEAEVSEIEAQFEPTGSAEVAVGNAGTSSFLQQHAPTASHLHLACHARGDPLEPAKSVLELADDELPLSRTVLVGPLETRLAVASACQTAVAGLDELADEILSIGSALIVAGSACVISTLWSVDDFPTALLMTRLYENLFAELATKPPDALRQAQLWLRSMSEAEEAEFLSRHPALHADFEQRRRLGDLPGRREPGSRTTSTPYAHPDYWAAFIASGT